jgi:hypothetical protein
MSFQVRGGLGPWALTALGLVSVLGCGEEDELGQRYAVHGVVTYNGEPVPNGSVSFMTDAPGGRSGSADIKPDGSYSATTLTTGDGLLPGKYNVAVNSVEVDMKDVVGKPGGLYRTDLIKKAPKKRNVPKKYASPVTSGLTVEVKQDAVKFDITLTD